jgi:hypothetical protein
MLTAREALLLSALRALLGWDSARALGTLIVGAPGTGKTILESLLLLFDVLRGRPGCVLDPLGTLSEAFFFRLLWFLSEFPLGDDAFLWQRLRYIEVGSPEVAVGFPVYRQRQGESLWETASRLITVLERASPQLVSGSPLTWPAARRLGINAGMLLTALSCGLDQIEDLLFHTSEWEKTGKFQDALNRNPQAEGAVSYFTEYYLPLPRSEQRRIAGTLLDQLFPLLSDPTLRRVFAGGGSTPGIDWEELEALGQIVILSFKSIRNPAARLFAMHWIFEECNGHLQARGRRPVPFVLTIDEFANLTAAGTAENKPLADLFDELLAQFARNNRIFVTLAFQSLDQLPDRLQHTVLRSGTIISGRAGTPREARVLADVLFRKDPMRIKNVTHAWGRHETLPPWYAWRLSTRAIEADEYFPLEAIPHYMSLDDQQEEAAGTITKLGALEFLCRSAVSERAVSQEVVPLFITDAITDPDSGEYVFPDPDQDAPLIAEIQQGVAERSGIPRGEILKEQETVLPDAVIREPARQDGRREAPLLPAPRKAKEPQSHPTLTDTEQTFLTFLIAHPADTPISSVYKRVGLSGRKGAEIRERLRQLGFIQELAVKTDRGRPLKFVLPTISAFAFFEKDPPPGRGSVIHKHVQHLVASGATAKGYSATCEKVLATGGIVDVHLEKGNERIAVEIAISSSVDRESTHIGNCLAAGYDFVFALFADENLLNQVETMLHETCAEDLGKRVKLLPLSKLAHVGYG